MKYKLIKLKKENDKLKEALNYNLQATYEQKKSARRIEYYEKYIDEHIDTQEWVNFVEKYSKTDGIVLFGFEGDEEIEANELSTRHREYILQKERMGSLRYVLGWNLYQEWVKETITGH